MISIHLLNPGYCKFNSVVSLAFASSIVSVLAVLWNDTGILDGACQLFLWLVLPAGTFDPIFNQFYPTKCKEFTSSPWIPRYQHIISTLFDDLSALLHKYATTDSRPPWTTSSSWLRIQQLFRLIIITVNYPAKLLLVQLGNYNKWTVVREPSP